MAEPYEDVEVTENPERTRFEARIGDALAGVLVYADDEPGTRTLLHTVVGEEYGGHGVGGALASRTLADARERGLRIVPVCTFVQAWLERHPEHADLVA